MKHEWNFFILAVCYQLKQLKKQSEKNLGLNGIWTHNRVKSVSEGHGSESHSSLKVDSTLGGSKTIHSNKNLLGCQVCPYFICIVGLFWIDYMAGATHGQDEGNPLFCLITNAGKVHLAWSGLPSRTYLAWQKFALCCSTNLFTCIVMH